MNSFKLKDIKKGETFIECNNLVKIYQVADIEVFALQGLDVKVNKEEVIALVGASGSGKSTLMNVLGGLEKPTGGTALVGGVNLGKLSNKEARLYKRQKVGFVWQNVSRNLVPYLTAFENVQLPLILNGKHDKQWVEELLVSVGLQDRMNNKPTELSGGQQQRVAIAIAIANKPDLLLADEPTGSLDRATGDLIIDVFHKVRDTFGLTVVIVTHDMLLAKTVDRYIRIRDGKITSETVKRHFHHAPDAQEHKQEHEHQKEHQTHEEFIMLDSAGRLQLPPDYKESLGIKNKVKMHLEEGKIIITPQSD